jgi:hypothetical protein
MYILSVIRNLLRTEDVKSMLHVFDQSYLELLVYNNLKLSVSILGFEKRGIFIEKREFITFVDFFLLSLC